MAQMEHSIRLLSHGAAQDRHSASFLSLPEREAGERPQVWPAQLSQPSSCILVYGRGG